MGWKDCITISWVGGQLYCNTVVTKVARRQRLYHNTVHCIVLRWAGRLSRYNFFIVTARAC